MILTEEPNSRYGASPLTLRTRRRRCLGAQGKRLEITFEQCTSMAHTTHLHDHRFQAVEIEGACFAEVARDTALVPSRAWAMVAFDADRPSRWAIHCHNLFHAAVGMILFVTH